MVASLLCFTSSSFVLAQQSVDVFNDVCVGSAKDSPVCKEAQTSDGKNPLFGPDGILTYAIRLMSTIVGVAAVIALIYGGMKYITSGSNPQDVTKAREIVIYAIVGVIITALAQIIVNVFLSKVGT